jgi:hypothetical protein
MRGYKSVKQGVGEVTLKTTPYGRTSASQQRAAAAHAQFEKDWAKKQEAEKQKQGEKKSEQGVAESSNPEILFYAKLPNGQKVYARVKDAFQLDDLHQEYKDAEVKTLDFNRPDVQKWLEARRVNMRKFVPGMVTTMGSMMEKMLPKSAFTGSSKNKLGSAGQWKNTGPSKNRAARAGDLVGGDAQESISKQVSISEDCENIMDVLINKIIVNEAIQNNRR